MATFWGSSRCIAALVTLYATLTCSFGAQDGALFTGESSKVREVDEDWFLQHDGILRAGDPVWLVNLYSASCGHCQRFAPTFDDVAAAADDLDERVGVIAVNCDTFRDLCTRFKVQATPTLLAFGTGTNPNDPSSGVKLGETLEALTGWVEKAASQYDSRSSANQHRDQAKKSVERKMSVKPQLEPRRFGDSLSGKELMRRDLANAVRFGLESGVFLGRRVLQGDELNALYAWLNLLRQSFPGDLERKQLETLLMQLKDEGRKGGNKISSDSFDTIMYGSTLAKYDASDPFERWRPKWTLCSEGDKKGVDVFGGYPCALWTLLHVLTVSTASGGAAPEMTLNAIVGFIKHFFACNECRDNFLASNPQPVVDVLQKATQLGILPSRALVLWLWAEHNAVSRRLNSEAGLDHVPRLAFPPENQCRSCRNSQATAQSNFRTQGQLDVEYLVNQLSSKGPNALYREMPGGVSRGSNEWDFDVLFSFLVHTYCFEDSKLHCPQSLYYGFEGSTQSFFSRFFRFVGVFVLFGTLCYFGAKPAKTVFTKVRKSSRQRR